MLNAAQCLLQVANQPFLALCGEFFQRSDYSVVGVVEVVNRAGTAESEVHHHINASGGA